MQDTYWKTMTQYKNDLIYYRKYYRRSVKIDRWMKIAIAVVSAESVANVIFWDTQNYLWLAIVFVMQVVMVVNDYLPYQKRAEELGEMRPLLEELYVKIEHDWFRVQNGVLSDTQINDLRSDYITKWNEILGRYFEDDMLPERKSLEKAVETEKKEHFVKLAAITDAKPAESFEEWPVVAQAGMVERSLAPRQLKTPVMPFVTLPETKK